MFDQEFFRDDLPRLRAEYARQHQDSATQVELLLPHGLVYRTEAEIAAGPRYVTFEYSIENSRRQAHVPYSAILAVNLAPAQQARKRVTGLVP